MIRLIINMNIKMKLGILFFILCISIFILGYKTINISEENQVILKDVHSKSQAVLSLQNNIINPLYNLKCSSRFIRTGCRSDSDSFKVEIF